jgi:hypothetical protein
MDIVIRLAIDLSIVLVLIRFTYVRHHRRSDLFLTFFSFNMVIFMIAHLLTSVEISLGAGFGLFAVFSMLRYRTEGISTPDMTYLFMVIALGLVMAVSNASPAELALIGATMILLTEMLESSTFARRESSQKVHYDEIRLIADPSRADLLRDLRARTGLEIHRVEVDEIDFLRDAARLTAFYYEKPFRGEQASPRANPSPIVEIGST